jgi:hypothetical protein
MSTSRTAIYEYLTRRTEEGDHPHDRKADVARHRAAIACMAMEIASGFASAPEPMPPHAIKKVSIGIAVEILKDVENRSFE